MALYRKYRSATFAELVGQDHVTRPLQQALANGRINHAYLFSGPRGCGKTSSARILARSLNCVQGPTPTPCGVCDSCVELAPNGAGSIDVIEIDAASHGGVDDARDLRERAFFAPVRDRFKVYIIDEAHMVTTQGFNALLKLVEEPPDFLVFVFATTEPDKVLQTIRSRTHHYPFRLIPPSVMRAHLESICAAEHVTVEPAVLPLVVRAGGGSARDSLSILDQLIAGADERGVTYAEAVGLLGVTDAALLDDMVDALAAGDAAAVYGTVDRVVEAGHDPRRFAADLLDRFRDLILLDSVPEAASSGLIAAPQDELAAMSDQANRLGGATLTRFAEIVHNALIEMRGTTSPRLVLELLCARMQLPDVATDSAALLQRIERLELRQSIAQADAGPSPSPAKAEPVASMPSAVPVAPTAQEKPVAPTASTPVAATTAEQPSPTQASAPSAEPHDAATTVAVQRITVSGSTPSGVLDATGLRRLWPEVLDAVKLTSRRTRALLDNAQVAGVEGDLVTVSISTAPLARMLNETSNTEVVVAALGSTFGGTWRIAVETGAVSDERPPQSGERTQPSGERPSQAGERTQPSGERAEMSGAGSGPPKQGPRASENTSRPDS
ncbi:MAG: DNA polymerase III subunit gamma and tau, partial [Actinobacteria bacterium]|nr:DNA polymerase III subunit gamma and tau [Actinomycetota bacterium]